MTHCLICSYLQTCSTLNYKPILQRFAKAYGIKVSCYGEHVGENIENLMGIHWELKENIMRTHWEQGKNEKKSPPPPQL